MRPRSAPPKTSLPARGTTPSKRWPSSASHGRATTSKSLRTRAERAAENRAAFEREAAELERELPQLEQRARELSREIPGGAPPEDGDLTDWASRARAELFVATSQVDARRERAIREANELASALLGESTHGSTPEQALARVDRYWTSAPGQVSESR